MTKDSEQKRRRKQRTENRKLRKEAMKILKRNPWSYMKKVSEKYYKGEKYRNMILKCSVVLPSIIKARGLNIDAFGGPESGKSEIMEVEKMLCPAGKILPADTSPKGLMYANSQGKIESGRVIFADEKEVGSPEVIRLMKQTLGTWGRPKEYLTVIDGKSLLLTNPDKVTWWINHNKEIEDQALLQRFIKFDFKKDDVINTKVMNFVDEQALDDENIFEETDKDILVHRKMYEILLSTNDYVSFRNIAELIVLKRPENIDSPRQQKMFYDLIRGSAKICKYRRKQTENDKINTIYANEQDFKRACQLWSHISSIQKTNMPDNDRVVLKILEEKEHEWIERSTVVERLAKLKITVSDSALSRIFTRLQDNKMVESRYSHEEGEKRTFKEYRYVESEE